MRQHTPSAGSAGLPARLSVTGTVLASLAMALAVVALWFAFAYPFTAAAFLAGGATAYAASLVGRRLRKVRERNREGFALRVPFTDRCLEL